MKVLVACEFSGVVRDAFLERGHDAWSCDLLPTDSPGPHIQRDVREILDDGWDLMIAHPPCTYLTLSNASRFVDYRKEQAEALQFVADLMNAPIDKIAVENPRGVISSRIMKPSQEIQPYMFGHPEMKRTCLWLFGLPLLESTNIVELPKKAIKKQRVHWLGPTKNRWKLRSITYQGIADAMANQWG